MCAVSRFFFLRFYRITRSHLQDCYDTIIVVWKIPQTHNIRNTHTLVVPQTKFNTSAYMYIHNY